MEAEEKIVESEKAILELRKLEKFLYEPISRFRHLRVQVSSSADILQGLQKNIKKARKKNRELTVQFASDMEMTDSKILDKFYEAVIESLQKTLQEVKEKWAVLKENRGVAQK